MIQVTHVADVYLLPDRVLCAPQWHDGAGRWAWTSDFTNLAAAVNAVVLGRAVLAALVRSETAAPHLADRAAERDRVDAARAAAAGLESAEQFAAVSAWVNVSRNADGTVNVAHSDAYAGDSRLYAAADLLERPGPAALGAAVLEAFARCTRSEDET